MTHKTITQNARGSMVQKAFAIIEFMALKERKLFLQEIATSLEMSSTTAHRIISQLREMGYVEQHADKSYYLSYKLFLSSNHIINRERFMDKVVPYMNYFVLRYEYDVGLSVCYDRQVVHVVTYGSNKCFRQKMLLPGSVQPIYCTAAGRTQLIRMSESELDALLKETRLVPYTRKTIVDPRELKSVVEAQRKLGYGYSSDEYVDNISCLSVPIRDPESGMRGAMNFSMNTKEFNALQPEKLVEEAKFLLKEYCDINK